MEPESFAPRILVVSSNEKLFHLVPQLLPDLREGAMKTCKSAAAARRALLDAAYDIVLVSAPLSDEVGTRFAIDAVASNGTVALVLAASSLYSEIYDQLSRRGVFVLQKPTSMQTMQQSMQWLVTARQCLRSLEKKATSVEEKMAEIRQINRAKWLLIDERGLTEAEAHHYIEREAMNRCISKRTVAEKIIALYPMNH